MFSYSCAPSAPTTCPASSADHNRITNINAQIYVDPDPAKAPAELRVVSGIFLRNQNEQPTADFNSTAAGNRTVILNASASNDPEGRTLAYDWFLGNGTISLTPEEACAQEIKQKANGTTLIYLGQGVTYRYAVPTGIASPMNIQLVVRDPGCLFDHEHEGGDDPVTRRILQREDGWVLVSAIVLMAIMVSVGLSSYAFVDTGQKRSRESRERESSLSLAEAAAVRAGLRAHAQLAQPEQAARRRLLVLGGAHGHDALLPRSRHARQGQLRQRRRGAVHDHRLRGERDLVDLRPGQLRRAQGLLRPRARQ